MSETKSREGAAETSSSVGDREAGQREPDERVRLAQSYAEGWRHAPGADERDRRIGEALTTLNDEVRRLQAAQREPVAEMVGVPDGMGTVIVEFYGERPPAGTKLYAQAQRDDHPPPEVPLAAANAVTEALRAREAEKFALAALESCQERYNRLAADHPTEGLLREARDLLDWCVTGIEQRVRAADLEGFPYLPQIQECVAKLDAALAASKGTPDSMGQGGLKDSGVSSQCHSSGEDLKDAAREFPLTAKGVTASGTKPDDNEDFEVAVKAQWPDEPLVIGEDGYYLDERVQAAWWGWQSACRFARECYAAMSADVRSPDFVSPVSSPDQTLPAPSAVAQWQPIESAPRDRWVLTVNDFGYHGESHWETGCWINQDMDRVYPTHWMPIPEPPADVRSQAKDTQGREPLVSDDQDEIDDGDYQAERGSRW